MFNNENTAGTLLLLLKQIWFLNALCFGPAPPPDGSERCDVVTSLPCVASELAAYVCVSPARPESDGGARPESVHPSVGKNSQGSRVPPGHTAVCICLSRGEGTCSGSEL